MAANWAQQQGIQTVFGGICHPDTSFVEKIREGRGLESFDALGIHAFPGMWEPHATGWEDEARWRGWADRIDRMSRAAGHLPIWITESGLATYSKTGSEEDLEQLQICSLQEAMALDVERFYWYTLWDLNPAHRAIEESEDHPSEEAEYHLGLIRFDADFEHRGQEKPAFYVLKEALQAHCGQAAA